MPRFRVQSSKFNLNETTSFCKDLSNQKLILIFGTNFEKIQFNRITRVDLFVLVPF